MMKRSVFEDNVMAAVKVMRTQDLQRSEIEVLLVAIQKELDEIGGTFGMQRRRVDLKLRKDELLDRLLELRGAAA